MFAGTNYIPARASRPARGAWIEIISSTAKAGRDKSRPARGAWIEMTSSGVYYLGHEVAPRTGRVD